MDLLFESTKTYGSQLQNTIVDKELQMQDRMLRDGHAITSQIVY
jgi:hypothetical protein